MICNNINLPPSPPERSAKEIILEAISDQSNVYGRQLVEAFLMNMSMSSGYIIQLAKKISELDPINNMKIIPNIESTHSRIHTDNKALVGSSRVTEEEINREERHHLTIGDINITIENKSAKGKEDLIRLIDDLGGLGMDSTLETQYVKINISIHPKFTHKEYPGSLNDFDAPNIDHLECRTLTKIEVKGNDGFYLLTENTSQKTEIKLDKFHDKNGYIQVLHSILINTAIANGRELQKMNTRSLMNL